jgi:hypothetical protein
VLVGDDAFRLSTVRLGKDQDGNDMGPEIVAQHQAKGKAGNMWAGMVSVNGYVRVHQHVCTYHRFWSS